MRDNKPNFLNQTDAILKFAFEKACMLELERPPKSKICNLNLLLLLFLLLLLSFLSIQLFKISEDLESTSQFKVFFFLKKLQRGKQIFNPVAIFRSQFLSDKRLIGKFPLS